MSIYAIGDIQGCYDALRHLLDKLGFDPDNDQIWLAGDLVNRGDKSLEVLRFVRSLGDSAICVLGNHDITLIAAHYGLLKPESFIKPILKANDRGELIDWLRTRPLLHQDPDLGFCMTHAGISPHWSLSEAVEYANEVEALFRGDDRSVSTWLKHVYGDTPKRWSVNLDGYDRHRYIINAFTRMRFVSNKNGTLNFKYKNSPKHMENQKYVSWFKWIDRKNINLRIVFGHWASLGYYADNNTIALDSGCVWGNSLTAVQLDTKVQHPVSVACNRA
jgi:bis(5'-nucleosyl)-tetraphosphatase (symmetrical)